MQKTCWSNICNYSLLSGVISNRPFQSPHRDNKRAQYDNIRKMSVKEYVHMYMKLGICELHYLGV